MAPVITDTKETEQNENYDNKFAEQKDLTDLVVREKRQPQTEETVATDLGVSEREPVSSGTQEDGNRSVTKPPAECRSQSVAETAGDGKTEYARPVGNEAKKQAEVERTAGDEGKDITPELLSFAQQFEEGRSQPRISLDHAEETAADSETSQRKADYIDEEQSVIGTPSQLVPFTPDVERTREAAKTVSELKDIGYQEERMAVPSEPQRDITTSSTADSIKNAVKLGLMGIVGVTVGAPVLAGMAIAEAIKSKSDKADVRKAFDGSSPIDDNSSFKDVEDELLMADISGARQRNQSPADVTSTAVNDSLALDSELSRPIGGGGGDPKCFGGRVLAWMCG